MEYSFGEYVLILYTLIDGKVLSCGYSNMNVPIDINKFQMLYRKMLVEYIETHTDKSKQFLDLCIEHISDINNNKFGFVDLEIG